MWGSDWNLGFGYVYETRVNFSIVATSMISLWFKWVDWQLRSETQILIRNPNFDPKPKLRSETQISIRNPNFDSISNQNFVQKSKFWCGLCTSRWKKPSNFRFLIEILISEWNFDSISDSDRNLGFRSKYGVLIEIWVSERNFDSISNRNLGFGSKFGFQIEIWVSDRNLGFGSKFGVWIEIWGLDQNLGFGSKFGVRIEISTWYTWIGH